MDFTTIILVVILLVVVYIAYKVGHRTGAGMMDRKWQEDLPGYRQDAINRSRAVLGGHFSEQLAPYLPDFPFSPTESRFIGKPIDLIVFKGADGKNIDEVVFVEVKSGKSKLSAQEKNLKETIDKKRVRWEEYRIPEDITKKRDVEEG
ncbi:MAG: hypothetical protein NUV97_01230 [archaeon]|nr:hypothetical protein [archaeon]MCR4323415.1 hypothetical protein [Nanoarchaeota archaeon]